MKVRDDFLADVGDTLTTISSLIDAKQDKDEEYAKGAKRDKQTDKSHSLIDDQEKMQSEIDELQKSKYIEI